MTEIGDYHVEALSDPFTCFDATNYGALMIIDIEDYFSELEILKLRKDIEENELSIIIFADWFNKDLMSDNALFSHDIGDELKPVMAGSNVGTLNALLEPYNIAFGDKRVFSGDFILEKRQVVINSGTEIVEFPKDGFLISAGLIVEN